MAVKNDNEVLAKMRECLTYDRDTGKFYQAKARQGVRVGQEAGAKHSEGYIAISFRGRIYKAHRMAWAFEYGSWPEHYVDHIDGDGTNNAIANLREADQSRNLQNQRKARAGKKGPQYLGVQATPNGKKFYATIKHSGKQHHLGYFETPEEAYIAYLLAKMKHHVEVIPDRDFWNSLDLSILF